MTYTFFKGMHYAWPFFMGSKIIRIKEYMEIEWAGMFHENCLYTAFDKENDYNKVCGFSMGWHHDNSVRIGARISELHKHKIELASYIYQNKVLLPRKTLTLVEPKQAFHVKMILEKKHVFLTIDDEISQSDEVLFNTTTSWGYTLGPYFGGNNPAPHKMQQSLCRL